MSIFLQGDENLRKRWRAEKDKKIRYEPLRAHLGHEKSADGFLKQAFWPGRFYESENREDDMSSMGGVALFGGGRAIEQSARQRRNAESNSTAGAADVASSGNGSAHEVWLFDNRGEDWYYRARQSNNPIDALTTLPRRDSGDTRSFSAALLSLLERQYQLHPGWSYELHHENLACVAAQDEQQYGRIPSYSTLLRRMKSLGWTKKRRPKSATSGQIQSFERRENREVRSYESSNVGELGHLDFHHASRRVVGKNGEWFVPVCFACMDDYSRLCFHAQWYLVENTDNLVHGFCQALLN